MAFTPENLDSLLTAAAFGFINDKSRNSLEPGNYRISRLFQWYRSDFSHHGSIIQFINRYLDADEQIPESATLNFMEYDWSLNE